MLPKRHIFLHMRAQRDTIRYTECSQIYHRKSVLHLLICGILKQKRYRFAVNFGTLSTMEPISRKAVTRRNWFGFKPIREAAKIN